MRVLKISFILLVWSLLVVIPGAPLAENKLAETEDLLIRITDNELSPEEASLYREINSLLNRSEDIPIYFFGSTPPIPPLEYLQKLKQALLQTHHIRDFDQGNMLSFTNLGSEIMTVVDEGTITSLPISLAPEAWISELSDNPEEEPAYLSYKKRISQDVLSLEEIYSGCGYTELSIEKILQSAQRTDRVLVTVLDTGVAYNHPELAYKIPRMPTPFIQEEVEKREITYLEDRKKDLLEKQKKCPSLVYFDITPTELSAELAIIEKSIERVKNGTYFRFLKDQLKVREYSVIGSTLTNREPYDVTGHGTKVAGIIVKDMDDIALLPIYSDRRSGLSFAQDIQLAHATGSKIVNMSIYFQDEKEITLIRDTIKSHPDMLFIAGAGNDSTDLEIKPKYPAALNLPNLIKVTSVNNDGELSSFSNYNSEYVEVAAPGENISVITQEEGIKRGNGTSYSTPFITRIAAQIKFINPNLTPTQIKSIIMQGAQRKECLQGKVQCGAYINEEDIQRVLQLARQTL